MERAAARRIDRRRRIAAQNDPLPLLLACRIGDGQCAEGPMPKDPKVMFAAFGDLIEHGLRASGGGSLT